VALTVAELNTRLTADTRDLQAGLRRAESDVKAFGAGGSSAMRSFQGALGAVAASAAFQQITQFLTDAVKGASDLAEAANAVGVAFGQSTPEVTAWAQGLSNAFGATNTEALSAASQFQLVAREAGFTATQITDLAERAFDLGSVFNQSAADVSTAIKAGLVGEFEPLRRFGVILSQDRIQAIALAEGLIKPKEEMSAGVKQAVIYNEILRQTAFAQGDAENTAESAAGQMREFRAATDDLKTSIGAALLPAFVSAMNFVNSSVIPGFEAVGDQVLKVARANLSLIDTFLRLPAKVLDKLGFDQLEDFRRGLVGFRAELLELENKELSDFTRGLIDTNAAGGAAAAGARDAADGVRDLGDAAKDAADALEDLKDAQHAAKDAAFALEDAQLAAADAQKELDDLIASGGVDREKVVRATEDLARANDTLADASERVNDAQEDYNDALADAHERHLRDVQNAEEDLVRARQKLANETQDVADAEAKLAKLKAQRQARDQAIKNAQAQLAAADTVTERIVAQEALSKALGMEIVTDEELAAAQSDVAVQQGEVKTATDDVAKASRDLQAVRAQDPAQSDSVKNAAERLETAQKGVKAATDGVVAAQNALNLAQQPAPGHANAVEVAQRGVERANWAVEKATWALEKAQRAYNQSLIDMPKSVTSSVTRNEVVNVTRNEKVNFDFGVISLPSPGSGTVVPLQMRPTLVMHDGGVVPGPRGSEVPALLEAGERVIPAGGGGGGGSDRPIIVRLEADGRVIQEILLAHQRRSGSLGFN
jgi:hypothetical protein